VSEGVHGQRAQVLRYACADPLARQAALASTVYFFARVVSWIDVLDSERTLAVDVETDSSVAHAKCFAPAGIATKPPAPIV